MRRKNYKHPSESIIIKTEVVCPNDTNPLGILKGGRLVEWMDMAAAGCAQIHTGKICVTAAINHADFIEAVNTGAIISIKARMTRVFTSSMEILAQAFVRNVMNRKQLLISEAYFTFVALNDEGKATKAIAVKPVSASEKKKFDDALFRKKNISVVKRKTGKETV